jgi:hypothetical protein
VTKLILKVKTYFVDDKVIGLGDVNVCQVKLKSGGDTPLDVMSPLINILIKGDSLCL